MDWIFGEVMDLVWGRRVEKVKDVDKKFMIVLEGKRGEKLFKEV